MDKPNVPQNSSAIDNSTILTIVEAEYIPEEFITLDAYDSQAANIPECITLDDYDSQANTIILSGSDTDYSDGEMSDCLLIDFDPEEMNELLECIPDVDAMLEVEEWVSQFPLSPPPSPPM